MSVRRRRFRKEPVPVGARLGAYRRGAGAGGEVGRLQEAWVDVVGAQAAAQSVVVRRSRAGVVSVACASSGWAQELDLRRDQWTRLLDAAVPELSVTGLRFVVGDHVIPAVETPTAPIVVKPTAEEIAAAEPAGEGVTDPVLRELLVRAAAGQAALAREKRKALQNAGKQGRAGRHR